MAITQAKQLFLLSQAVLALVVAWVLFRFFQKRDNDSQFQVREADRARPGQDPKTKSPDALANARLEMKRPLALTGIRIDGPAHEVLGVPPQAGEAEIQKAYRELMKRYHPDAIGRPGSREWQDAQKIAERLNAAKAELLERAKKSARK